MSPQNRLPAWMALIVAGVFLMGISEQGQEFLKRHISTPEHITHALEHTGAEARIWHPAGGHPAQVEVTGTAGPADFTLPYWEFAVGGQEFHTYRDINNVTLGNFQGDGAGNGHHVTVDTGKGECITNRHARGTHRAWNPTFKRWEDRTNYVSEKANIPTSAANFTIDLNQSGFATVELRFDGQDTYNSCFFVTVTEAGENFEFRIPIQAFGFSGYPGKPGGFFLHNGRLHLNHAGHSWPDINGNDATTPFTRHAEFLPGAEPDFLTLVDGNTGTVLANRLDIRGLNAEQINQLALQVFYGEAEARGVSLTHFLDTFQPAARVETARHITADNGQTIG